MSVCEKCGKDITSERRLYMCIRCANADRGISTVEGEGVTASKDDVDRCPYCGLPDNDCECVAQGFVDPETLLPKVSDTAARSGTDRTGDYQATVVIAPVADAGEGQTPPAISAPDGDIPYDADTFEDQLGFTPKPWGWAAKGGSSQGDTPLFDIRNDDGYDEIAENGQKRSIEMATVTTKPTEVRSKGAGGLSFPSHVYQPLKIGPTFKPYVWAIGQRSAPEDAPVEEASEE